MKDDLISVIVPIYKVERYLEECVASIRNQSYQNLEIILVDDGSPDNCGRMCDKFAAEDSRITVIHKKNGGLSDARNAGIEQAHGAYFAFVDSDDWISPSMIENLYNSLKSQNAQIALCAIEQVDDATGKHTRFDDGDSDKSVSRMEAQLRYFEDYQKAALYTVAWNKLYSRTLFEKERYPKGAVREDEFITYKLLYQANGIAYTAQTGYYYRTREESIMNQFGRKQFFLFDAYLSKMDFYERVKEPGLWNRILKKYMRMIPQYTQWQKESGEKSLENLVILYRDELKKKVKNSRMTMEYGVKVEYSIYDFAPQIYYFLWKCKNRN